LDIPSYALCVAPEVGGIATRAREPRAALWFVELLWVTFNYKRMYFLFHRNSGRSHAGWRPSTKRRLCCAIQRRQRPWISWTDRAMGAAAEVTALRPISRPPRRPSAHASRPGSTSTARTM